MAHGDYHCCAICDSKMAYVGFDAVAKEHICSYCVANLARRGVIVGNVKELIEWITKAKKKQLEQILSAVGFRKCFYLNDVDEMVEKRGVKFDNHGAIIQGKEKVRGIGYRSKCCNAKVMRYPFKNMAYLGEFPEHWADEEWGCTECGMPCAVKSVPIASETKKKEPENESPSN